MVVTAVMDYTYSMFQSYSSVSMDMFQYYMVVAVVFVHCSIILC